ncbi:unnamed protein product, partial [Mesorhabditis belari]|uniref:Cytochrome P450 n=1 Tax=Mesorhabditis belari TaxID=2138241 RepID=A0AAF3F865_9BILA
MFFLLIVVILTTYALFQYQLMRKLPPGPIPFLFFGNFPHLFYYCVRKGGFAKALREIQKSYGDVHTLWLGPMPFVNLCTFEKAKELMVNQGHTQLGRFTAPFIRLNQTDEFGKTWGIISSTDETWLEHRRFALHTLRNFGMGRNLMEGRIIEELDYQLNELDQRMVDGKAEILVAKLTDLIVGSVINRLLFGYRFDPPRREYFFKIKTRMERMINNTTPLDFMIRDWWKYVPLLSWRLNTIHEAIDPIIEYVRENIKRRKEELKTGEYVLGEEPEDFIDAYLIEQKKRGTDLGEMTAQGLLVDLHDLWLAGQETTSVTLQWALHLLLRHPTVMKKCKEEILRETSGNRNLSLNDRQTTPYFVATCTEVQRHASILNFNLWRTTNGPSSIDGYDLPIGTLTTAQISLILSDPETFKQTQEFDPSRYLNENGKSLFEKTIPFGIGKRSCPGESLAKAEIYLILGNILTRYNITPSETNPPKGIASLLSVGHRPNRFSAVFEKIEI